MFSLKKYGVVLEAGTKPYYPFGHTGYSRFRSYTLWERTLLEQVVFLLFYISLLATGMVLITTNKVIRTIAQIVLALLAISRTSSLFVSEPIEIANDLIIVFYCVFFLIWVVLKRTFAAGPVTFHRIQGAIVVYLLVSFLLHCCSMCCIY